MDTKVKIAPGSVQETLMLPLFGRKVCAERFPKLYQDPYAAKLCTAVDYDFSSMAAKAESAFWQFAALEAAVRELDMVAEIKDYLALHPQAAVVNLGCGLNMTGRMADNGQAQRFNLDFPNVIATRNELAPAEEREVNLACDLNDDSWMAAIPAENGAIFYAAGVFHYFKCEEVRRLARQLAERFPNGRLVFDSVGPLGLKALAKGNITGINAKKNFCLASAAELEGWSPKIQASRQSYMHGYVDLKEAGLRPLHRFLARLCDWPFKMFINRLDFQG